MIEEGYGNRRTTCSIIGIILLDTEAYGAGDFSGGGGDVGLSGFWGAIFRYD